MDGVVLIRFFDRWMDLYGSGWVRCAGWRDVFFFIVFFVPFFIALGSILGSILGPQTGPKINFLRDLLGMRSNAMFVFGVMVVKILLMELQPSE